MMERTSGRRTHLRLALTLTVLWTSTACQDAKKDDVSAIAPTATPVPAPVAAPSEEASTPLAARPADEHNDVADAGPTDGGARQRRRPLVANAPAAGAAETTAPTTSAQVAEPTTGEGSRRKVATPMGNEQPYGTSVGSGAPVLKKKPLPDDDPWKKPQPPP